MVASISKLGHCHGNKIILELKGPSRNLISANKVINNWQLVVRTGSKNWW